MNETWLPIKEWEEFYAVSNFGRIKSFDRQKSPGKNGKLYMHKGRMLTAKQSGKYLGVSLFLEGVETRYYIHRLVAAAFIPNPNDCPQVNHKDGCKHNNHVTNLEWVTNSENIKHAIVTGLHGGLPDPIRGESHHSSKLTEHDVKQIRSEFQPGLGPMLARKYNVTSRTIYLIVRGITWKHVN
jgi:hypothetical protein